jgi:hypothetical protein
MKTSGAATLLGALLLMALAAGEALAAPGQSCARLGGQLDGTLCGAGEVCDPTTLTCAHGTHTGSGCASQTDPTQPDDTQCGDGEMCYPSTLTCGPAYCINDADCPSGYGCVGNGCEPPDFPVGNGDCIVDADCLPGDICIPSTGMCVGGPCATDADCPTPGQVCDRCRCALARTAGTSGREPPSMAACGCSVTSRDARPAAGELAWLMMVAWLLVTTRRRARIAGMRGLLFFLVVALAGCGQPSGVCVRVEGGCESAVVCGRDNHGSPFYRPLSPPGICLNTTTGPGTECLILDEPGRCGGGPCIVTGPYQIGSCAQFD